MTQGEIDTMVRRAEEWIDSDEAQEAIAEAIENTEAATAALRESRRVRIADLHEPMDF